MYICSKFLRNILCSGIYNFPHDNINAVVVKNHITVSFSNAIHNSEACWSLIEWRFPFWLAQLKTIMHISPLKEFSIILHCFIYLAHRSATRKYKLRVPTFRLLTRHLLFYKNKLINLTPFGHSFLQISIFFQRKDSKNFSAILNSNNRVKCNGVYYD